MVLVTEFGLGGEIALAFKSGSISVIETGAAYFLHHSGEEGL
jgi:hypothetical protein